MFCRVFSARKLSDMNYVVTAEMYNVIGYHGIDYGFPGIAYNIENNQNFDFVYLRYVLLFVIIGIVSKMKVSEAPCKIATQNSVARCRKRREVTNYHFYLHLKNSIATYF